MGSRRHRRNLIPKEQPASLHSMLADLPRAGCERPDKVKYRSLKAAETAADKIWWVKRELLEPYRCGDHYHLTKHSYIEGARPFVVGQEE